MLAREVLTTEAFALHFLEDVFAAGHIVGAWGDNATKKGTHDLYSQHGIDAFTWAGASYSAHGDAFMKPLDRQRAGAAVRRSLEAVLAAAATQGVSAVLDEQPTSVSAWSTYDACKAVTVGTQLPESAIYRDVAPIWVDTLMPSSPRDQTPPIRRRAELGPFLLFQSGGNLSAMFGGFESPEPGVPRPNFSLSADLGVGYATEGVTTNYSDGRFFATFGIEEESAQYDVACSGSCADERTGSGVVPRVPARLGYQIRVRMPFWLVPGDLLVAVPLLLLVSRDDLSTMGILAADGGLIPWQRVLPTAIGDFQFMIGRELAVTVFDMRRTEPFQAFGGTDASGKPIYNPTRVRSLQFEIPVLEYRAFRSYSEKLGASFAVQLGFGFEIPVLVQSEKPGVPPPDLGDSWMAYMRLFFDGRGYL
jgi:hypothetical protein